MTVAAEQGQEHGDAVAGLHAPRAKRTGDRVRAGQGLAESETRSSPSRIAVAAPSRSAWRRIRPWTVASR